jgi:hypothetical protein
MGENVDHRQHETGGLAGARLRDADQVAHHQHAGDGLRLDRSRLVIAGVRHRLQQFVRQAEIGKLHQRQFPKEAGPDILLPDRRRMTPVP